MDEAADEIERLRKQRNHWMRAAHAFDEHLATMRVLMMEQPGVRFGGQSVLTDEERDAIRTAEGRYFAWMNDNGDGYSRERLVVSDTIRKLLERLA